MIKLIYFLLAVSCAITPVFALDANLVASFPFNGDAIDASGNGHNGTVSGASLTVDRFGNPNSAYYFDGTNDVITVPNHTQLDLTGPLTVSAWMKSSPISSGFRSIVQKGSGGSRNYELQVVYPGVPPYPNQVCWLYMTGGMSKWWLIGQHEYADNTWHHLVGTWDGTNAYFYIDGVCESTGSWATALVPNSDALYLGYCPGYSYSYFQGAIDEVNIYNRSLGASEVYSVYAATNEVAVVINNGGGAGGVTSSNAVLSGSLTCLGTSNLSADVVVYWGTADGGTNAGSWSHSINMGILASGAFSTNISGLDQDTTYYYRCYAGNAHAAAWASSTLSFSTIASGIDPFLVAYYPFYGDAVDASGNGHNGTVSGASLTVDRFGNPNSAYYFDGTNDAITVPDHSQLDITGPITVEAWIKTSAPDDWVAVVNKGYYGERNFDLDVGGVYEPCWQYVTGDLSKWHIVATNSTVDQVWHNLVGTWDGTNACFYIDGVCRGVAGWGVPLVPNDHPVSIGYMPPYSCSWFCGSIDDVKIYNRALGSNEVYAAYGSAAPIQVLVNNSVGATAVSSSNATLNGGLVCRGLSNTIAEVVFYWGSVDCGTNATMWENGIVMGGLSSGSFSTNIIGLSTNATYYYRAYASNSISQVWALSSVSFRTASDVLDGAIVAYYPFSGNAVDGSGNGHNGTVNGATLTADRFGNPASAYYFDGTNDSITVPDHAQLDLTGPFTVEAWAKNLTTLSNFKTIICKGLSGERNYELQQGSPGYYIWLYQTGGLSKWWLLSAIDAANAQWRHLIGVWDGTNAVFYVDGLQTTQSVWTTPPVPNNFVMQIGCSPGYSYSYFQGTIDDIKIYNRALSSNEVYSSYVTNAPVAVYISNGLGASGITSSNAVVDLNLTCSGVSNSSANITLYWGLADGGTNSASWSNSINMGLRTAGLYSTNITGLTSNKTYYYRGYATNNGVMAWSPVSSSFTTPSAGVDASLVAFYPFNGNANDESGKGHNGVVDGSTLASDRFGVAGKAYYFDGTNDVITVADHSDLDITGAITVEAWVISTPIATGFRSIVTKGYYSERNYELQVIGPNKACWLYQTGGISRWWELGQNDDADNKWHYLVGVWDRTNAFFYVDGVRVNASTWITPLVPNNYPMYIGFSPGYSYSRFQGKIDDIKVYNRAKGSNEVYAAYVASAPLLLSVNNGTGASSVSSGSATLNGYLTCSGPSNVSADVTVYWGTTDGFANPSAWPNSVVVGSRSCGSIAFGITGLVANTTYYYRCYASNGIAAVWSSASSSFTTPATIVDPSLIAYYPFAGNANDVSGNGHNGTVNGATLTTDRFGNSNSSYYFDGTNDLITVPDHAQLDVTGPITVEAWTKASVKSAPYNQNFFSVLTKGNYGERNYELQVVGSNYYCWLYMTGGLTKWWELSVDKDVDGQWHHLVGVWDGTNACFYVDGNIDSVSPWSSPLVANNYNVTIGYCPGYSYTYFRGAIDEIKIRNRALGAAEVSSIYTEDYARCINSSYGAGGTIVPSGNVYLKKGEGTNFVVQAGGGYHIAEIIVNGASLGSFGPGSNAFEYVFSNVTSNQSVSAKFNSAPVPVVSVSVTNGPAPLRVNYDLSGSTDAENNIVRSEIDLSGDGVVDATDVSGYVMVEYTTLGVYTTKVGVVDAYGARTSSNVIISVWGAAPSANLDLSSLAGSAPMDVTFYATNSWAATGHKIVVYEWDYDGDGFYDRISATNVVHWTYADAGTNNPTVRITDDQGLQDIDSKAIIVEPAPNAPYVRLVSSCYEGRQPLTVTLTADVYSTRPIVSYLWDLDGDGDFDVSSVGNTIVRTYSMVGAYKVTVKVADDVGLSTVDTKTISVIAPSYLKVWISTPKDGWHVCGDRVTVHAHAAPASEVGSIQMQFKYQGDSVWTNMGSAMVPSPSSFKANWNVNGLLEGGNYQLRVLAQDVALNLVTSDVVTVVVDSGTDKQVGKIKESEEDGVHKKQQTFDKDEKSECNISDGTTVEIPAQTVASNTTVHVEITGANTNGINGTASGQCSISENRKVSLEGNPELNKPISIVIPYRDDNDDGIVDGTSVPEETLSGHWFDTASNCWRKALSVEVHSKENFVKVRAYHLTEYALVGSMNLLHPASGGRLNSYKSEKSTMNAASHLTDGNGVSYWQSRDNPTGIEEFVYSFADYQGAVINEAVFNNYGESALGLTNYSKDFSIKVSMDGVIYDDALLGVLPTNDAPYTVPMNTVTCRYVKLIVSSGVHTGSWNLAEFALHGAITNDPNANGMADGWEMQYFGNFNRNGNGDNDVDGLSDLLEYQGGGDPTKTDTDNDGLSDFKEWVAGTTMNNQASRFEIVDPRGQTNAADALISWDTVPGRFYSVLSAENLLSPVRQTNMHRVNGTGQRHSYTNSDNWTAKFFFIKVEDR